MNDLSWPRIGSYECTNDTVYAFNDISRAFLSHINVNGMGPIRNADSQYEISET